MTARRDNVILQVSNLSVGLPQGRDRSHAVKDVSFSVSSRQIVCLVGESGSGKSVTASSIMQLLPGRSLTILQGTIQLEGEELTQANAARLRQLRGNRMAMVFQEPLTALNPVMRVGDQIAEVIQLHRPEWPRAQVAERVQALMRDVHLPDPQHMARAYPHQLSGGQRQRIVIAMALALEPALIIADEPTTALDVTTQAQILRLFKELLQHHDSGVLMITHDLGVVADVADEVLVMRQGSVVEQGPPEQILRTPRHPYTKMLLDAVPRLETREPAAGHGDGAALLDVRGLCLSYRARNPKAKERRVQALKSIDLRLAPGEVVGVVGESGSGKSTLARAILRFEPSDSGQVLFEGADALQLHGRALSGYRRQVQMIFQDPYKSLNPRRSVGESIIEGPVQHGTCRAKAQARARELLELVGLPPQSLDRYPHEFSGGQRQRICIARALVMEPKLIIADVAVSALDVSVQAQVLELIDELKQRLNFAMLFITHDLRVASNLCDRIVVMRQGAIVEQGTGKTLFTQPRDAYTRALLEAIPGKRMGL
jgi:peptide/nickel transport system ATP-binding protein